MRRVFLIIIITFCSLVVEAQSVPKNHIFNSDRLITLKDTTFTGIVTYVHSELDGDYHVRLKLADTNFILLPNNYSKQDSCMILEIVCAHKAIFPMSCSCKGYINKIIIPKINDKIKVTGSLVVDKTHNLLEIHPVTLIEIIK